MRKFLTILSLILFAHNLFASRAVPYPVKVTQPDGSVITITKHGDEFFNYTTDSQGYPIAQADDQYYYYADYSTGKFRITATRAGRPVPQGLTKGVPAYIAQRISAQRQAKMRPAFQSYSLTKAPGVVAFPSKTLVILVQFADKKFTITDPQNKFTRMLNEKGYADDGATGSAKDYFSENSMGVYDPVFVVTPVVTLTKKMSYYGSNINNDPGNDAFPEQMVVEACNEAEKSGISFAEYDQNGDGVIDNIFVVYAGYDEARGASADAIWSHASNVGNNVFLSGSGKKLYGYACTSELNGTSGSTICGIGTFCHEMGHNIGLSDLYDTSGQNKEFSGFGYLSVMDMGNYVNNGRTPPSYLAIEREILGWISMDELAGEGLYTLPAVEKNKAYKLSTPNPGEFFVIENRRATYEAGYQGSSGLLIYHIDRSNNYAGGGSNAIQTWTKNEVNNYMSHLCAKILKAVNAKTELYPERVLFPGSGKITSFTGTTNPGSVAWSGAAVGKDIAGIMMEDGIAKFTVTEVQYSSITVKTGQTDAFLKWAKANPATEEWIVKWKKSSETGFKTDRTTVGRYHISGITPNTVYDVEVIPVTSGAEGDAETRKFTTAAVGSVGFAAIGEMRPTFSVNETIYLMLINVPQTPKSVVWKIDGNVIDDYQLIFNEKETGYHNLSCEITYSDSDVEIITRRIKIIP